MTQGKLDFSVSEAKLHHSDYGDYATITVTTTCTNGRIYDPQYPHGIEGGNPTLILEDGTELNFSIAVTQAITTLNMKKGDIVESAWEFWLPTDAPYDLSEGEYTVRVDWFGETETFTNIKFTSAD